MPVRSVYFQREEFGTPMSALFLGNGVDSELVGCNRLLVDSVAGRPFVFQGAVGPVRLSTAADRMVRHLAVELDATNEQQDKLRTIVRGAVKDLVPLRARADAAREKAQELGVAVLDEKAFLKLIEQVSL